MKFNKFIILSTSICLLFSQMAFAGRMGGGRSFGMQRNISPGANYSRPQYQQPYSQPAYQAAQPNQQRSGMSPMAAGAIGAAAGAAGGYMLGRSMANDSNVNRVNSSNVVTENAAPSSESHIPWGIIAILAALLFFGLMLFRRKANPGIDNFYNNNSNMQNMNYSHFQQNSNYMSAPNQHHNMQQQSGYNSTNNMTNPQFNNMSNSNIANARMPDGVETIYFLRQVKGMFLHIQSMNNQENISEVAKYMTPELYQELQESIINNNIVADFSGLDCQLINTEITPQQQLIASVKFFGLVSDEPNQPAKPFSEIWNFVKTDLNNGKWLVAGIQQENLS